jgi:hypothetical protein
MAKGKIPPQFAANAARMKAGKPLAKKSGGTVTPKNVSKRGKGKSGK